MEFDVIIIGAGSAGLSALAEVEQVTKNYLVIDSGPLGTMCARTGCMPSKILLQVADDFDRAARLVKQGLSAGETILRPRGAEVMQHVRRLRDHFVEHALEKIHDGSAKFLRGRAKFIAPRQLRVGERELSAKAIIVATGTQPKIPPAWKKFGERLLTSETIFEMAELPASLAVIGGGPVGLELGQAMARLGVKVDCFVENEQIAGLTDPEVQREALTLFGQAFALHVGDHPDLAFTATEGPWRVTAAGHDYAVEQVLISIGRAPDLSGLGLTEIGIELNENGFPDFDPQTFRLGKHPIFIAGDCAGDTPVQHEAVFEGRAAGYNAVHVPHEYKRLTPLRIAFTDPQVATVGRRHYDLKSKENFATGSAHFKNQGRSVILGARGGVLHVYGDLQTGRLLGAEMICPEAEHLAHLLALAIERELSCFDLLKMPVYHPTVEEGLRTALRGLAKQIPTKPKV